jgi:anti-sigma B factor antagonist
VFAARETAEAAYATLLERYVPPQEIVYLTRSDSEHDVTGRQHNAAVGGLMGVATGLTAVTGAAMLFTIPGIGQVVAMGFGAAALLGLAGAGAGAAFGSTAADDVTVKPTPLQSCAEDAAFFRRVLTEGQSLIVVRSHSQEIANVANGVLTRLGINLQEHTRIRMNAARRVVGDIAIIDVSGRITLGEGSDVLRRLVSETLCKGYKNILFHLREVDYIDSSGLGEIVKSYTSVRGQGGQLKLVEISQRVRDLLQMTKLDLVLEIEPDEATAIQSFGDGTLAQGTS